MPLRRRHQPGSEQEYGGSHGQVAVWPHQAGRRGAVPGRHQLRPEAGQGAPRLPQSDAAIPAPGPDQPHR
ncbi:MAG: hypothetical protein WKG07_37420 [Hymenobacter sp.]